MTDKFTPVPMPGSPGSTREKLLKAASASIAESGVRGLRIEDVAARADVAVSLLYYYFKSRAGLLQATMEFSNERAPTFSLDEIFESEESAYQLLEGAMLREFGSSPEVRENCVVWNELTASAVFDEELRKQIDEVSIRWTKTTASFIESGQADGSIRADVEAHAEAELLTSLLDGLISRWLSGSLTRTRAQELMRILVRDRLEVPERVRRF